MRATSFRLKDSVLSHFGQQPPIMESDYYMTINAPLVSNCPNIVPIKSFTFPDSPMQSVSSDEHAGNIETQIKYGGQLTVTYYTTGSDTIFEKIWGQQCGIYGAPIFIPKDLRPSILISRKKDDKILVKVYGCKITYPKPSINLSGSGASEYTVTITYSDVTIE